MTLAGGDSMGNLASSLCHGSGQRQDHGAVYPGFSNWLLGNPPSVGGDTLPLHEQFRLAARQEEALRQSASKASQAAYHNKEHQSAGAYSAKAKQHAAERDRLNAKAANACFDLVNPTYNVQQPLTLQTCDLHGLTIAEAIQRAKTHVRACRDLKMTETVLITGKGLHSQNGRARLKPALEQFCQEEKIGATIDPRNEGRIQLHLDPRSSGKSPWWLHWLNGGGEEEACLIM